jgi:hypothetical protein
VAEYREPVLLPTPKLVSFSPARNWDVSVVPHAIVLHYSKASVWVKIDRI